jgi:hypothetical protein
MYRLLLACLAAVALLAAVAQTTPPTRTYLGAGKAIGRGTVTPWVTVAGDNMPVAIGVNLTPAALAGLPNQDAAVSLVFPQEAFRTPFTHFVLNWNAHGHIPAGIYNVPHFDFHFYTLMPDERVLITNTGEDVARVEQQPAAGYAPQGYIMAPGGAEPLMGAHWVDPLAPEFHGQSFTQSFIYGYYGGRLAFLEPMVTLAYLHTNPNYAAAIPQPANYFTHDYYPTQYVIRYDATSQLYVVALQGFVKR